MSRRCSRSRARVVRFQNFRDTYIAETCNSALLFWCSAGVRRTATGAPSNASTARGDELARGRRGVVPGRGWVRRRFAELGEERGRRGHHEDGATRTVWMHSARSLVSCCAPSTPSTGRSASTAAAAMMPGTATTTAAAHDGGGLPCCAVVLGVGGCGGVASSSAISGGGRRSAAGGSGRLARACARRAAATR